MLTTAHATTTAQRRSSVHLIGPDPIDVAVGKEIRARRKWLGISQSALADALTVSFQQVQKYERGANRVSASMLVRIAQKLDTSVGELVGETPGQAGDPIREAAQGLIGRAGGLKLLKQLGGLSDHAFLAVGRVAEALGDAP